MKTVFVAPGILFLLAASSGGAHAQVGVGLRGGVSASTIVADEHVVAWRRGLHAGVFLEAPLLSWLWLRPEVSYANKGARTEHYFYSGEPPAPNSYQERWDFDYVGASLLAHAKRRSASGTLYGVAVGPMVSRLVRNRRVREDGTAPGALPMRETSLGLALGLVGERGPALMELRYEYFGDQLLRTGDDWLVLHYVALAFGLRVR